MIDLPDPSSLRSSVSNGPESWTEAWSKVAETTDETMRLVENITATEAGRYDAYQSYIDEVQEVTGVTLRNPLDVDLQTDTYDQKANPTYGFGSGVEFREERLRVAREQFDAERAALAARYPAQARLIQFDLDARVNRQMQDAERAAIDAATSPELGLAGRLSAQIFGGLKGSARDPYQWAMSMFGAGAGTGPTVAARIGKIMVTEALLNGGQEALLQAASQERKKRAGLEHGMKDALANVGIAATFGALFGGTVQGGAELARIFKLGEGGAEQAARVLEGRPEPGDVETLAKAMNVELGPEKLDMISRSFEERVLDDVTIPADASPQQLRVLEAAQRYAEDPDNFPPPELVERVLADEEAFRTRFSPEQYERMFSGDPNAIDDIADTFFAENAVDAAARVDQVAGRVAATERQVEQLVDDIEGQRLRPQTEAEPFDDPAMRFAEEQAGEIADPRFDANGNPESWFEFLPFEDGDGNKISVPAREALAMADEPLLLADLLEACKL